MDEVLFLTQELSKFFTLHSLQGITDRLIAHVRRGELINECEKTKVTRISRQPSPVKKMTSKQLANVKHYKHLGSLITECAKRTREIKSRNFVAKNDIQQEGHFFAPANWY